MNGQEKSKDNWDKVAILGGLLLPVTIAAAGVALTWFASQAQREYERMNARVAQTTAIATLLDALTAERCEESARKTVAIRLVYYVLPVEAAQDLLLAISQDPDSRCVAAAAVAFQARLHIDTPELAVAQATILGAASEAELREAARTIETSRYAPLVLPTIIEEAARNPDERVREQASEFIRTTEMPD